MHPAGQYRANQQPQEPGQIAELRGEHRPDQGAGARDRGEMVAEQDDAVGRHVVAPVGEDVGRGAAQVIEGRHLGGQERPVGAVGDHGRQGRGDHQVEGGHASSSFGRRRAVTAVSLVEAGELLEVQVLDHVIVAE